MLRSLLTLLFPRVEALRPAQIFGFFCSMMMLHLIWVLRFVPETRGISLEEMQSHLAYAAGKASHAQYRGGGELEELVGGSGSSLRRDCRFVTGRIQY